MRSRLAFCFRVTGAVALALLIGGRAASAQAPPATPSLAVLDGPIGRWQGTSEGRPGRGTIERAYARVQ